MDRRRGLPRAARLPHGRSVRAAGRRVRRRPDRAMDASPAAAAIPPTRAPRRSPTTTRRRTWRASRRPSRPAATGARTCSTTRIKGITQFTFPHDTLAIATGRVTYDATGTTPRCWRPAAAAASTSRRAASPASRSPTSAAPADASTPAGTRSVADDLTAYSVSLGSPEQNIACADDGNARLPVQLRHRLRAERRRPQRALEHAGRAAHALRRHQADPVAGRRLRLGRHDDGVGPQPRRDLGSGGPAHRHADAKTTN